MARGVLLPPVDALDEALGDLGAGRTASEEMLGAVDFRGFGEDGGAAVADEDVDCGAECGVGADAGVGVGAAALQTENEIRGGDGGAGDVICLLEQLVDRGDALLDRDGGATLFLDGAGAQGAAAGAGAGVMSGSI